MISSWLHLLRFGSLRKTRGDSIRGKSTTQSHRSAIFYVDLTVREGITLAEAVSSAKVLDAQRRENGLEQDALDTIAKAGFGNAAFEFSEEEIPEVLEEFYPRETEHGWPIEDHSTPEEHPVNLAVKPRLVEKLDRRAAIQRCP